MQILKSCFLSSKFCVKTKQSKKIYSRGFTLVEIMTVIAIIGILAALIFVATQSTLASGRDARRQGELVQVKKVLQQYYLANNSYPITNDPAGISLENDSDTNGTFTQTMKGGGYLPLVPRDPKYTGPTGEYAYKYIATTTDSYTLCAKSESKGGYICTTQASDGVALSADALVFGEWGGGPFVCGSNITFAYKGSSVTYGTVGHNGECWLDRNLGASRVATAFNDSQAYGDLLQWGRSDDGHQIRTSSVTSTLSGTDNPGHSNFITVSSSPWDWRSSQNNNLWNGVSGINNPCPSGWRIPTSGEITAEVNSWSVNNYNGAFASPLKLTAAGCRDNNGSLGNVGSWGYYWDSAVGNSPELIEFFSGNTFIWMIGYRASGYSVRCIKD